MRGSTVIPMFRMVLIQMTISCTKVALWYAFYNMAASMEGFHLVIEKAKQ